MTNKATKYGLMTIAAVLLVALVFAGAVSAEVTVVTTEAELQDALNKTSVDIQLGSNIDLENCLVFGDGSTGNSSTLDLNGFVLYQKTDQTRVLKIMKNATLRLTDSGPSSVHAFAFNRTGVWDYDPDGTGVISIDDIADDTPDGTLVNVTGGVITSVSRILPNEGDYNGGGGAMLVSGSLVMEGGSIAGCGVSINNIAPRKGGAVSIGNGIDQSSDYSSFIMKGNSQIIGCAGYMAGAIVVESTASDGLVLTDNAVIRYCYATSQGGAIRVYSGSFTMSGGCIKNCSTPGVGGGVMCFDTMVMSGGSIEDCSAKNGGGVYVYDSTFTMSGGCIKNCSSPTLGGGVFVRGTFTMRGGSIEDCCGRQGGGVYLKKGTFTLSGGKISDCRADDTGSVSTSTPCGGGVFEDYDGVITMTGGSIEDCSGYLVAGGVLLRGTMKMSGGEITGCTAGSSTVYGYGGGVYVEAGTFDMSGGTFANCYSYGQSGAIDVQGGTTTISGTALIEDCYACDCAGGIECVSKGTLYVKGGTFRNNVAGVNGGAIRIANGACWISGGIFENNTAQNGGAISVAYSNPCIITGGIFRDNHDSTGSNAITTEKRHDTALPNLIIGGDVTLEDDQSFRLIDLPSGTGSFKIGTPTDITGASFTDEKFTGSIKNFVIDNESLDGRTLFEIKVDSPGQDATDVLGRLGLKDTDKWTLTADDDSNPKKITIKLNKPVASSASVLFSEDNTTAYVNITLTDDNDAASAVVEFWNASGKINSSNVVTEGLTKGSTVGGFVVEELVENYEYTVTANLTMVDSKVIYANYTLGTFNCSNPKITKHPQSAVYKLGETAEKITVEAEAVTPTYQWENSTDGKTFNVMSEEKYDNITPSNTTIGTTYYRVKVTADEKSVYSLAAAVEVYDTYTITYNNPQSGSSANPTTYSTNESVPLNDPVMPYYVGTWVDRNSHDPVSVIYKGTTGDLILDAQYTAREYYIMYIDGGTTTNPASYNVKSGTIYLTDATRNGYKFIGWYDNAAFTGDKVTSISSAAPEDITLYAQWVQQVTKTVDSEGNATFNGDERIATARISGTQTLLSEVSGLTPGKNITFVRAIPELSASDLPAKSGYYTNLYSAFEINYDSTLSGGDEAQITLKVTLANGDSADSLCALHQSSSGWEDLEDVSKTQSGNEVTIVGNVSSFSPFAVVSYSAVPQQYVPSSSKQTGSTIILQEGQVAPTPYPTVAPTGDSIEETDDLAEPVEQPATPTVIATAKPTTQATQQSPAPFLGIIAGLGAAAVLLRLRK